MWDPTHAGAVLQMMAALYAEDEPAEPTDPACFPSTIEHFLVHPTSGKIILLIDDAGVAGYALLVPYWSNEYGGRLVFVDELYVLPRARGQGYARQFFAWLKSAPPYQAVAILLEVTRSNARARRLYESLGFTERKNETLAVRIGDLCPDDASKR